MDYDTKNSGLEMELVIRTGGYRITLDVPSGDVRVCRDRSGDWHIALRRRRCVT